MFLLLFYKIYILFLVCLFEHPQFTLSFHEQVNNNVTKMLANIILLASPYDDFIFFSYDDSFRNISTPSNSLIILKDLLQITTELTCRGDGFPGKNHV